MLDMNWNLGSTVMGKIEVISLFNAGDSKGAAAAILQYDGVSPKGKPTVRPRGVSLRRQDDQRVFLGEAPPVTIALNK